MAALSAHFCYCGYVSYGFPCRMEKKTLIIFYMYQIKIKILWRSWIHTYVYLIIGELNLTSTEILSECSFVHCADRILFTYVASCSRLLLCKTSLRVLNKSYRHESILGSKVLSLSWSHGLGLFANYLLWK